MVAHRRLTQRPPRKFFVLGPPNSCPYFAALHTGYIRRLWLGYFTKLQKELENYLDQTQVDEVYRAYLLARKAHQGQKRLSGEAYITHPVAAAVILAQMRVDYQSIMATLLHDVLEDTKVTKEQLIERFGEEVAELVDGVSKLTQIKFESRAQAQAENFRKMVLAMVRDIRVILVKLADRLHNMRTLGHMPPVKQRRIANETLDIYAPIANRLGMHGIYVELEDLSYRALYPMRFRILEAALKKARGNRRQIMQDIEATLNEALGKHDIKAVELFGRQKHLYSIYKKMRAKKASFTEIMDVYGFRLIVPTTDDCYRALGVVHRAFKPRPERFKDYIAIPKVNGYQSLHTTLHGPYGVPIEVQIRSVDMNRVAENGIAAHWLYKSEGLNVEDAQTRAREWVKGLLEMQQSTGSSLEFIESVKIDLFPDEVYVFTPRGDILELPRGATPVDFAYLVHSDIGNSCVAAKVDRRLAPLSTPLSNGQVVEVITAPGARPNPAWLSFVATGKARSNIRHFLKTQQAAESCALGKRLLQQALSHLGQVLEDFTDEQITRLAHDIQYNDIDDLYQNIGLGNEVALVVAKHLIQESREDILQDADKPLLVRGTEGMVLHFSECCRPIPGDPIVGCLTAGQGIDVHVEHCPSVAGFYQKPDKFIHMMWQSHVKGEFMVDVHMELINQRGALAEIARSTADSQANIVNIVVDPLDGKHNSVRLTLTVEDRDHLARVMRALRRLRMVVRLARGELKD
jgi:GTP diphosphokinase / guanosine-3',5'-bis(diphosphate) 3'-diphosphatase